MLIHLINLDRSKDRLATFALTNQHLTEVSRVPAVDGATLDVAALVKQGVIADGLVAKDFYTIGALGAAFSHISLWQSAVEAGQMFTIAEDDAVFHSRFETLAPKVMEKLPPDWDLISWGWNFDLFMCFEILPAVSHCLALFEQDRARGAIEVFQNQSLDPQIFRLIWQFGTSCYSVSPKGARTLQEKCLPLQPVTAMFPPGLKARPGAQHFRNVGIDSCMNNAWKDLNAFVCVPPLVITKNDASKSTVQSGS